MAAEESHSPGHVQSDPGDRNMPFTAMSSSETTKLCHQIISSDDISTVQSSIGTLSDGVTSQEDNAIDSFKLSGSGEITGENIDRVSSSVEINSLPSDCDMPGSSHDSSQSSVYIDPQNSQIMDIMAVVAPVSEGVSQTEGCTRGGERSVVDVHCESPLTTVTKVETTGCVGLAVSEAVPQTEVGPQGDKRSLADEHCESPVTKVTKVEMKGFVGVTSEGVSQTEVGVPLDKTFLGDGHCESIVTEVETTGLTGQVEHHQITGQPSSEHFTLKSDVAKQLDVSTSGHLSTNDSSDTKAASVTLSSSLFDSTSNDQTDEFSHDTQTSELDPEDLRNKAGNTSICTDSGSVPNSVTGDDSKSSITESSTIQCQAEVTSEDCAPTESAISYENDFSKQPQLVSRCHQLFSSPKNNYLKGCKWSPDGTCLVTNSNDSCLRLFNLPQELYAGKALGLPDMQPVLKMPEGEMIFDYCWLPTMSSMDPDTCCVASTSRESPVHLWDAFSGALRSSYLVYDQMDELDAAQSLCFSPDSSKLYCGFRKKICVFDVDRPGRDCEQRFTFAKKKGQTGIISCIAVNPANPSVYVAGSYSREVAVYSEPKGSMVCMFKGQQGGVTHLKFSPDGNKLFTGGRKDPEILCWDLRNPGQLLFTAERNVATNQRIYFDLDCTGQYLLSGNHDGNVSVWDTLDLQVDSDSAEPLAKTVIQYQAHSDTTNGISVHPSLPLLATTSGQHHYHIPCMAGEPDLEEDAAHTENSLKLWWTGQ